MAKIGLISCVSKKCHSETFAKELYTSALFTKSRQYVERNCDTWFILSAKYGLVEPNEIIEPYNETLNSKTKYDREEWAKKVWKTLCLRLKPNDQVTILAGDKYREKLIPLLIEYGCKIHIPMKGLGIGSQLKWLSRELSQPNRQNDIERLYRILRRLEIGLGGKRLMAECTGKQKWPTSGVYFFFEPNEFRSGSNELRIVRVGTHRVSKGSKSTLWNRLRTHRGTDNGGGNHRGSIFRLHIGAALSIKEPKIAVDSWGKGQSANAEIRRSEINLERRVSNHIGNMKLLWLSINDEASPISDRAYIERNIIGMLVGMGGAAEPASSEWLGLSSPDERIRQAGLWNLEFLDYSYSPDYLDVIEEYVEITLGNKKSPACSIAPQGWYIKKRQGVSHKQLLLFGD